MAVYKEGEGIEFGKVGTDQEQFEISTPRGNLVFRKVIGPVALAATVFAGERAQAQDAHKVDLGRGSGNVAATATQITAENMPLTASEIKACRVEAAQVVAEEQKILSERERQQEKDQRKRAIIAGAAGVGGAVAGNIGRNGGWGAQVGGQIGGAIATAGARRDSEPVKSETENLAGVSRAAYEDCRKGKQNEKFLQFLAAQRGGGSEQQKGSQDARVITAEDGKKYLLIGDKAVPLDEKRETQVPDPVKPLDTPNKKPDTNERGGWRRQ